MDSYAFLKRIVQLLVQVVRKFGEHSRGQRWSASGSWVCRTLAIYQWLTVVCLPTYTFVPSMARVSHLPGLGVELDCC